MFRANVLFRICLGIIFIATDLSLKISAVPTEADIVPRQDQADVTVGTEVPVLEAAAPAIEASAPAIEAAAPAGDSQIAAIDDDALDSGVEALSDDDDEKSKDGKSKDNKSKDDKSKDQKTQDAGSCDLDSMKLPSDAAKVLPPPSNGLKLRIITVGRGTQNYSCTDENGKKEPIALGAKATLFDTSCTAAKSPEQFAGFARSALDFDGSTDSPQFLDGTRPAVAAQHFFSARKTADFDFSNAAGNKLGHFQVVLDTASPAPPGSQVGKNNVGDGAVPWLRAVGTDIGTGAKVEIYRLHTAGGSPSKTCDGKPENFEVQYAAEYLVFQ